MKILTHIFLLAGCVASASAAEKIVLTLEEPSTSDSASNELLAAEPSKKDVSTAAAEFPTFTETYSFTDSPIPLDILDGTGMPGSDTRVIAGSQITSITSMEVSVKISNSSQGGAYNGDYYLSLQHESGFAVLLNRVGRRPGDSPAEQLGYGDNGFDVTFRDDAALGDIHTYRLTLEGGHDTPIDPTYTEPLRGIFAPDGRETSPQTVLSLDNRTALLSSFNSLPANGSWTLEVVDFNFGGEATIDGWAIKVIGIPEPATTTLMIGAGAGWLLLRGRLWKRR